MVVDRNVDRDALRLAATPIVVSLLLLVMAQFAHNTIDGKVGNGNTHVAEFTAIAAGSNWTVVHVAQFLATAVLTAGVLALFSALNLSAGRQLLVTRCGMGAAVVSLALAGAVYAVDGVALKQASDAWVHAPAAQKPGLFAAAEGIRWLEWGTRSYNSYVFGLALVLLAVVIAWTARLPPLLGYVIGVAGLAAMVLGWQTGVQGFAPSSAVWFYLFSVLFQVWTVWLLVLAWRTQPSSPAVRRQARSR
jgi:hypothetical protein